MRADGTHAFACVLEAPTPATGIGPGEEAQAEEN